MDYLETVQVLAPLARYGDRQRFAPFGLFGGQEGSKGKFVLNPHTPEERPLKSKGMDVLKKGDVVSLRLPGPGGYGDPLERDPELLLADVRDGKVTNERDSSLPLVAQNDRPRTTNRKCVTLAV